MKLLVDTNIFLRLSFEPERVPRFVHRAFDLADLVLLSAASAWEIAIKASIGKLNLPVSAAEYVPTRMERLGIEPLPVNAKHATAVQGLPFHHRDPFDRLLVAQAGIEALTIVTADKIFSRYGIRILTERMLRPNVKGH